VLSLHFALGLGMDGLESVSNCSRCDSLQWTEAFTTQWEYSQLCMQIQDPNYNSTRDSGVHIDRYCSDHLLYPSAPNKHFLYSNRSLTHPPLSKNKYSTYLDHPLPTFPHPAIPCPAKARHSSQGVFTKVRPRRVPNPSGHGVYLYIKNNTYHLEPPAEPGC